MDKLGEKIEMRLQPRGTGKKFFVITFLLNKFISYVDKHSKAVDSSCDKTYTLEQLREYIPYFIEQGIDENII